MYYSYYYLLLPPSAVVSSNQSDIRPSPPPPPPSAVWKASGLNVKHTLSRAPLPLPPPPPRIYKWRQARPTVFFYYFTTTRFHPGRSVLCVGPIIITNRRRASPEETHQIDHNNTNHTHTRTHNNLPSMARSSRLGGKGLTHCNNGLCHPNPSCSPHPPALVPTSSSKQHHQYSAFLSLFPSCASFPSLFPFSFLLVILQ